MDLHKRFGAKTAQPPARKPGDQMELHRRFDGQPARSMLLNSHLLVVVFLMIFVLPVLLLGVLVRDLSNLTEAWPWRNAKPTNAVIASGGTLEYSYRVGGQDFSFEFTDWPADQASH